jgi:hypothetical protein
MSRTQCASSVITSLAERWLFRLTIATSLNHSAMWTCSFAIAYLSTNRSQSTATLTTPPDR